MVAAVGGGAPLAAEASRLFAELDLDGTGFLSRSELEVELYPLSAHNTVQRLLLPYIFVCCLQLCHAVHPHAHCRPPCCLASPRLPTSKLPAPPRQALMMTAPRRPLPPPTCRRWVRRARRLRSRGPGGGEQAGENGGALLDGLMRADADGDGRVSRAEFVAFFRLRDGELRAAFDDMDLDGDGRVSSAELRQALVALDVRASDRQLRLLMTHLDRNGDGHISYGEFRGFFLLLPLRSAEAVFEYWSARHIDLGEDFLIPDDKEKHERDAGPGVVFTAGAVAGAVSRSVTAPFDRLKVMVRAAGEDLEGKEGEE